MFLRVFLPCLLAVACFGQSRDAEFGKLADRYFDEVVFRYDPVQATSAGFHQYDSQLPSLPRPRSSPKSPLFKRFEGEVEAFGPGGLSATAAADRELVLSQIRGTLLELKQIRPLGEEPRHLFLRHYQRDFRHHEPEFRARGGPPAVGGRAREADPARLRIGAPKPEESAPGLHRSGPRADAGHRELFPKRRARGLPERGRPAAPGRVSEVQPGRHRCAERLREVVEERSSASLQRRFPYRRRGLPQETAVRRDGGHRRSTACSRSATRTCGGTRPSSSGWRPRSTPSAHRSRSWRRRKRTTRRPGKLLPALPRRAGTAARFHRAHHIVTIPSQVSPIVEETPPFMRALTTASMDTPGPYEKVAKEAYLQRHAARAELAQAAGRRVPGRVQPRNHHLAPRCTRSTRALHAVPVDRAMRPARSAS